MRFEPHRTAHDDCIIRPEPLARLIALLDSAVREDPSLAEAARVVLRPVQQLDEAFALAAGVLGDEQMALHHLRLLLGANTRWKTWFGPVAEARRADTSLWTGKDLSAYASGLVHEGALVALVLAVRRMTRTLDLPAAMLQIPFGMALACGPAEALVRLGPDAPRGARLAPVLHGLLLDEPETSVRASLSGLLTDPAERARWLLLKLLHDETSALNERLQALKIDEVWDSARAAGIEAVLPIDAAPGQGVHLVMQGEVPAKRAVFASPPRATVAAALTGNDDLGPRATVPAEATWGWVGLEDKKLLERSNRFRGKLAALLGGKTPFRLDTDTDEPEIAGILRAAPVPVHLLAKAEAPGIPPFLGPNRFHGGRPRMAYLGFVDPRAGTATLAWDSAGAERVRIERADGTLLAEAEPSGSRELPAGEDGVIDVRVTPVRGQGTAAIAGDPHAAAITVAPAAQAPGQRRVVVFRPALFTGEGQRLQAPPDVLQMLARFKLAPIAGRPWLPDELAVGTGPIGDAWDYRVDGLLDALRKLALSSPGGEDALWLAVVPDPPDDRVPGWHRWREAAGALAVAVASQSHIEALLRELQSADLPAEPPSTLPSLRLVGTLSDSGLVIDSLREEERPLRMQAPPDGQALPLRGLHAPSFAWVLLDAAGNRLTSQPADISLARTPALVTALLPVDPRVQAIALRHTDALGTTTTVCTLRRPAGTPAIEIRELGAEKVAWKYEHSEAAAATLILELGSGGVWSESVRLSGCAQEATIPRAKLGAHDAARITACDGWNLAVAEVDGVQPKNTEGAAIRRLDNARLATEWPGDVRWTLNGEPLSESPVIARPAAGHLVLAWFADRHQAGSDELYID